MKEKIYQVVIDDNYALADITESINGTDSLELSYNRPELIPSFKYDWVTNESTIIPDCIIIMSELLGGNEHFSNVIKQNMPSIMLHPVLVGDKEYDIYTGIPYYYNRLNLKSSKVTRFSNREIMNITSPVFLPNEYAPLFKIDEMSDAFFCTNKFKETVEMNHLKGLNFIECVIKSKFCLFNF